MRKTSSFQLNNQKKHLFLPITFLFALSIALYFNTISHQYALDDSIVIVKNQFTKKGIAGIGDILTTDSFTGFFGIQKNLVSGGRYRPLSLISFAIEYQFFGLNPGISHLINVILFALTIVLIFKILQKISNLSPSSEWWKSFPFLASLLFAVHPLHTEVVANIKGRDEIFALLGGLLSFWYAIKYIETKQIWFFLVAAIFLFLGLLSKENAIAYVIIIPIGIWIFLPFNKWQMTFLIIVLFCISILFVIIRANILGPIGIEPAKEWMNNPFLSASVAEKYATIFFTFLIYFKLLFVPFPLTYDYYPKHIELVDWKFWGSIGGFLITISLIVWFLYNLKRKSIPVFALLIFGSGFLLASNLIFPVGVFMAERFLYMPSLGFCVWIGWILIQVKEPKTKNSALLAFAVFIGVFAILTIVRNKAWKNDFVLFTTDVKTSANSAKANCTAGGKTWEEAKLKTSKKERDAMFQQSLLYLNKAVEIYPGYNDAILLRGNVYWDFKNDYKLAVADYLSILKQNSNHTDAFNNALLVLNLTKDQAFKLQSYLKLQKIQPNRWEPFYYAGTIYGRVNLDLKTATIMFEKALSLSNGNKEIYKDLGVVYGMQNEFKKAISVLQKAIDSDPDDHQTYYNMGVSYAGLKDSKNAQKYFTLAEEKKKVKN